MLTTSFTIFNVVHYSLLGISQALNRSLHTIKSGIYMYIETEMAETVLTLYRKIIGGIILQSSFEQTLKVHKNTFIEWKEYF